MQRLFAFLLTPAVACLLVTGVALWMAIRPRGFQQFVADNFALLPRPGPRSRIAPVVLRLLAVPLLCYAYTMAMTNKAEFLWLARLLQVV